MTLFFICVLDASYDHDLKSFYLLYLEIYFVSKFNYKLANI